MLNSARQTGSVIGVALFGTLIATDATFLVGLRIALGLAVGLLLASAAIAVGAGTQRKAMNLMSMGLKSCLYKWTRHGSGPKSLWR